ncbi:EAL domain-containing protein [Luteimonas fraxinea]|uniref:EAL domain-containing protein n=1 Tax=Luteimonas fraxinea TaxID=2901869 RepID=A0ABS8UI26_9GAMM|nr:EAL domain-containing protein [Luteimonas fraxinea]MCD9098411.1 EAL domain-containing protein [Luteimonas fraxinea]UHH10522.1 EAL domain-containing protein [Luteimonas fraxinea]
METDADNKQQRRLRSVRAMRNTGIWLGIVLTVGLCALVLLDRQARLDAASRQSMALATGVDRLLHYELRNIQRAMHGIAAGQAADATLPAPEAAARLDARVHGVVNRHQELEAVLRFDANGNATPLADPRLSKWVRSLKPDDVSLAAGPLLPLSKGWLLPLAVPTRDGTWMVAMFRTGELENMVNALDIGREGSATIYTQTGVVVARFGHLGTHVGKRIDLPAGARGEGARLSEHMVSQLDGVKRAVTFSNTSDYPFVVSAGIGLHEALAQWRIYATSALVLALLYWGVFGLVLRRARRDENARKGLAAEVAEQADWLQQAQLASGTGVWRLYPTQGYVRATDEMVALYGLARRGGRVPVNDFFERIHEDDRTRIHGELSASQIDRQPFVQEYRVRLDDGRVRWLKARGATVCDEGEPVMTGTVIDVTERRDSQQRMERAELQFRHIFERNPLPAWVYDLEDLHFLAVNEAAVETYGYSREDLLHMAITDLLAPEDQAAGREALMPGGGEDAQDRLWMLMTRDARHIEVRVHARTIELDGRAARLVLAEDVSVRMGYERDLAWRANHDPTTGMLTLAALAEQLDSHCSADGEAGFAIAYVQLRDLELIAPTLGRRAGENILCEAAARISDVAERYGACGYMPSETFVVAALDPRELGAMVTALLDVIGMPVEAEGGTFPLEAWIGLASGPCEDASAEKVIGHAALASLHARRENQQVVHYSAAMAEQASSRLAMVRQLRQAHERGEFELHFQPIHRLHDGSLAAIEALLRWRQPDGSYVSPAQFIPLCEESGLIVPIGSWVLEESARMHARLVAAGHDEVAIAVNVSAVQFEADMTPESIRKLFERHALPPRALHLELTESVLLRHPDDARSLMGTLRNEGLCLSIDDFGTGFSSMAYLRELPLDHLKIDRAFVRDVTEDPRSAAICRALIALGHGLGLAIIAEGVEEPEQLEWLRAHGCDQAQGYHLGRPMPIDALLESLAEETSDIV